MKLTVATRLALAPVVCISALDDAATDRPAEFGNHVLLEGTPFSVANESNPSCWSSLELKEKSNSGKAKYELNVTSEYDSDLEDNDSHDEEELEDYNYFWAELRPHRRALYEEEGWTQKMWDSGEDAYFRQDWEEMTRKTHDALLVLGWTKQSWDSDDKSSSYKTEVEKKPWALLSKLEQDAAGHLGYDEETWPSHPWGTDFHPFVHHLDIPELQSLGMDFLAQIDAEVQLRDGATVGDDETGERETMNMKQYIDAIKSGSMLYLKYEDYDPFKIAIRSSVGERVLSYMGEALRNSVWRERGYYKAEYDEIELDDSNYMIWVGGANSSTAMHYDDDTFNFIWVAEGRKRIILLPNDERTAGTYECVLHVNSGCWTGVDILQDGPLPEHAIEVELGPGDGLMIPFLSWHAVRNLEPTVAYGFRIDL